MSALNVQITKVITKSERHRELREKKESDSLASGYLQGLHLLAPGHLLCGRTTPPPPLPFPSAQLAGLASRSKSGHWFMAVYPSPAMLSMPSVIVEMFRPGECNIPTSWHVQQLRQRIYGLSVCLSSCLPRHLQLQMALQWMMQMGW